LARPRISDSKHVALSEITNHALIRGITEAIVLKGRITTPGACPSSNKFQIRTDIISICRECLDDHIYKRGCYEIKQGCQME
jgi:hypothetical protein